MVGTHWIFESHIFSQALAIGPNWIFESRLFLERLLQVQIGFLKYVYFSSVRYRSESAFESSTFLGSLLEVQIAFEVHTFIGVYKLVKKVILNTVYR